MYALETFSGPTPLSLNALGLSGCDMVILEGSVSVDLGLDDGSVCECGLNAWASLRPLSLKKVVLQKGVPIPRLLHLATIPPCHALLTDTKPCAHPAGGNKSPRDCSLLP